jgi:hypothetical protein
LKRLPRIFALRHRGDWLSSDKELVGAWKFQALLGEPLVPIVRVNVAVLALALGIVEPERVRTVRGVAETSMPMIAVIAHSFGKVFKVCVLAVRDLAGLASRLAGHRGLRYWLDFITFGDIRLGLVVVEARL